MRDTLRARGWGERSIGTQRVELRDSTKARCISRARPSGVAWIDYRVDASLLFLYSSLSQRQHRAEESQTVATDWSREEVEATVADYFAMLEAELAGTLFAMTAHRPQLLP